jgi:hypothetical protein
LQKRPLLSPMFQTATVPSVFFGSSLYGSMFLL